VQLINPGTNYVARHKLPPRLISLEGEVRSADGQFALPKRESIVLSASALAFMSGLSRSPFRARREMERGKKEKEKIASGISLRRDVLSVRRVSIKRELPEATLVMERLNSTATIARSLAISRVVFKSV